MAVLKLSPFTTAISGSMKNLTFSTDGENTIMKERETPANPKTTGQTTNRGYFTRASRGYATLTPAQVALWALYGKGLTFFGKTSKKAYVPNAYEAYTSLANKFYEANAGVGTAPATPPTSTFTGDVITVTAVASGGKVNFTASGPNVANVLTELWLQPLKNPNRKPSPAAYRVKAYSFFQSGTLTTQVAVPSGYYAAGYRFVNKLTGQTTLFTAIPVTGIALTAEDGGAQDAPKAVRAQKAA